MADQWFIARNNKKFGPYSMQQMRALAGKRQLAPNDMLLKEGTAKWVAARSVKGLFADNSASASPSTLPTAHPQPRQEAKSPTSAPGGPVAWIQQQFRARPLAVCLAGGGLFVVLACGGICSGILHMHRDSQRELTDIVNKMEEESRLKKEEAKKKVAEANQAWSSGQKEKALDLYKRLIDEDMNDMPRDEMPTICQRVIDSEMKKGNTSAAKHYIRKAREHSVELAFNNAKAKEILRQVDAELKAEEREVEAELKAEERKEKASNQEPTDRGAIIKCGKQVMTQARIGASPQQIKALMKRKGTTAGIDDLEPTDEDEDVVEGKEVLNVKYEGVRFSFIRDRRGQWGLLGGSIEGKSVLPGGDLR